MYKLLTLNNISLKGLNVFPRDTYEIASEMLNPDAILLRSFNLHDYSIPSSVKAVGRAGAGVNNIPIDKLSAIGVPVFNTPGANANAVAELVLASILMASRNIIQGWDFTKKLSGDDKEISKAIETGKKNFSGFELPGKTLGVIGLGAIGVKVANLAHALGMNVIGYDPVLTVDRAWELSSHVQKAISLDDLISRVDYITFHVPFNDHTKDLLNENRIKLLKNKAVILNFARGGIVNDKAVVEAIRAGKVYAYFTDFPNNLLKDQDKVICLPHLGASTAEAEENCAYMIAEQIKDFLENGNIKNSVNFPEIFMPKDGPRMAIANSNVPKMVAQISTCLAGHELNIKDMLNKSRGDLAYTLVDVDKPIPSEAIEEIKKINGVLSIRTL
ncbi:MAG: phosphoglycerate dehydrogenase [Leptospiraceae bacterium]|nr:phosphoglycerate dehydrogenase [Leptospiraceae bacterium]MCP5500578.1 phosphoglycerate dehydrogenase [Leptospiraceae bacterium]